MERNDLIRENGPIFVGQGRALNDHAAGDLRVVVVGNPCNTNCLIAMRNAADIPDDRFTAMTRLDHNRARAQLAAKAGCLDTEVGGVTIFGNHSSTQYPDYQNATIGGRPADEVISDKVWLQGEFIETVQLRGASIIEARGLSSAASAANAAIDHMRDWETGTAEGDWVSMAVPTDGSYSVPAGVICGLPVTCDGNGGWRVKDDLKLDEFAQDKFDASVRELLAEKEVVADLLE